MPGDRSIGVGGDVVGSVFTTGDRSSVDAVTGGSLVKVTLPEAASVNITEELARIRAILVDKVGGEHAGKVGRALDDASEEAKKPKPDKGEVGAALGRAIEYAKKSSAFADQLEKLVPHISNAVGWLGSNWHKLLPLVGLTL